MDIRYVQSFVAVLECGSIAKAARQLDLTSAAVAARIRALEEMLGVPLLRRSGRFVRPTAEGLRILENAHVVLRSVRDLQAVAQQVDGQTGELRLGVFVSAMTCILPPVLQRIYSRYPELAIFAEPGSSINLCHKVASGELDAAIVVEPQFAIPKTCEWHLLRSEPLVVVAPRKMKQRQAHELLQNEPFIRYSRSVSGGQLADRYLWDHGIHPRQRLEIDGLLAIVELVAAGIGVSLIPDWSSMWSPSLPVACIPLPGEAPVRKIGLIAARHAPSAALSKALAGEIADVLRKLGPAAR